MKDPVKLVNWVLPGVTLAVYLVLAVYLGGRLMAESGGQLPFDLRAFGYSLAEARAYLRALTPAGFTLAEGMVRQVDTLFPLLMGLTFAWWMRPYAGVFGMVCAMSAMSYVSLDWAENWVVGRMLHAGPDWVDPMDVMRASILTQAKFAAVVLCAVLAARQSWQRVRGSR